MKSAFTVYFIIILYSIDFSCGFHLGDDMNVANLTVNEIIEKYGYPSEVHYAETEDGFILELHRIPFGKYSNKKKPGYPLLIEPGLYASSAEFFLLASHSLPFYLADAGYDVWVVNFRGNRYGSQHKYYTEDDEEYWDFSFHEMGIYDAPAQITYICNQTQHDDLIFFGYSMGSTLYFVMASERPEVLKKIRAAIILAPVVYVKHVETPARLLAPFARFYPVFSRPVTKGLLFKRTPAYDKFLRSTCYRGTHPTHPRKMCKNYVFFISGKDSDQLTDIVLSNLLSHIPDSASARTSAHYSQMYLSGTFSLYDWGMIKNKRIYNRLLPPLYKLNTTTTPLHIFLAGNDFFSTPKDLEHLFSQLPNIKTVDIVPYKTFTHMDFVTAKDAKTLVYDKIIERLKEILQEEESSVGEYIQEEYGDQK